MKRRHERPQGSISPILSRPEKTTGRKEKKTVSGYKIEFRGSYLGFCKTKADAKKKLANKTATGKSDADDSKPVRIQYLLQNRDNIRQYIYKST